ncbi:MAG: hypothetical protein ABIH79_02040 [archaeon]
MIKKKGAAHLEMIISFVFFLGFVFFLFLTLKPYDMTVLSSSVVAGLYDSFEERIHTNLTNFFLKAEYTGPSSCFYIQLPNEIFEYGFTKSLVTDVSDVEISSEFENNNLNINSNEIFYKVAISPEFHNNDLSSCEQLSNYSLGSLIERRVSSYHSLVNMSTRYIEDYENLKYDLNVPDVFDFGITCKELPEINMERLVPSLGDVVSRNYVLEVLKDTGEVINARFTIKVW